MSFTTIYLGHNIEIEPFEWGYLAHISEPRSNTRLVAASSSPFKALEDAFELIDDALDPADGETHSATNSAGISPSTTRTRRSPCRWRSCAAPSRPP